MTTNTVTERQRPINCPQCKTKQRLHLLVVPDKPAVLVFRQSVLCVECRHSFELFNDAKIVGGPFAV
jgi:hypothetical protein